MFSAHFFIEGQLLGQGSLPKYLYGGREYAPPASVGFFCPLCGEIWARMHVDGQPYTLWHRKCKKHEGYGPRAYELPGSVWLDWDPDYVQALPDPVVRREFALHMAHFVKWREVLEREIWIEE